jgi:ubiquitin-protein ligase
MHKKIDFHTYFSFNLVYLMALLIEIESNFGKLTKYNLVNNQEQFIVKFDYLNYNYELYVNKDLDYIYLKSDNINTDVVNSKLISNKSVSVILKLLTDNSFVNTKITNVNDNFGLYRNRAVFNKGNCNYEKLLKKLNDSPLKSELSLSSVPKNLLYPKKIINEMLINEIKMVNSNKKYPHYILPTDDEYTFLMYIILENKDNKELIINMTITFDPELYPFYPPSIKYINPTAKRSLIYQMSNLDILKLENWNPVINMDWLIVNLASNLDNLKLEYIDCEHAEVTSDLDKEIIEFSILIGEKLYQEIKIDLVYTKFSVTGSDEAKTSNKYWKSGVGYGCSGRDEWDITKFVKEQELKDKNIEKSIEKIVLFIKSDQKINTNISSILKFIDNNICNSTLLEIDKKIKLFSKILDLLKVIFNNLDTGYNEWKIKIYNNLETIREDISPIISSITDEDILQGYVQIISIVDYIKDNIEELIASQKLNGYGNGKQLLIDALNTDVNLVEEYTNMIKDEQSRIFSDYKITTKHRFSKHTDEAINPKSLMRISSEFSSMRKNLPNNWDTSIVVRASTNNLNIFSFVITGPKDTPYHNGIYEFHAHFPKTYPDTVPKVLLDTTGNSSVRFNPNLYNCGKVCLSLLGTWAGQDGESWNKSTSTFLQVLVSIQSLILVEQPYFNEPGWERYMYTTEGKRKSFDYNDNLRLENMRWAIVDKMKNPPSGFEELTKRHFELKKDEILKVTKQWVEESKRHKSSMEICRNELLKLYQVDSDVKSDNSSSEEEKFIIKKKNINVAI